MAERDPFDDRTDGPAQPTDYRIRLTGPFNAPDIIAVMPGVIQDILISLFASPGRIFKSLRGIVWTPDEKTRRIVIENFWRWNPTESGSRPTVTVRRGAAQSQRLSIGDRKIPLSPAATSMSEYVRLWTCGLDVFVAAESAIQADELMAEIRQHLQCFAGRIAQMMCLDSFEVASLGDLGRPEAFKSVAGAKDLFGTQLGIRYTLQESWELRPEAPLIEGLSVDHNPD